MQIQASPKPCLSRLLSAIDACNRQDPNQEVVNGKSEPKEWLYGRRMSATLAEYATNASEELQIAARAQHIERWTLPRSGYPKTRAGYLQWRKALGQFHAQRTAELMQDHGYSENSVTVVKKLLTKQRIKQDPEVQVLEDVICLVFVKYYLASFATTQERAKLLGIIRRTWAKMSERGQSAVLSLPLEPALQTTLESALKS